MTKPAGVIAVINRKGGVGKSTLSHALAFTLKRSFLTFPELEDQMLRPTVAINHMDLVNKDRSRYSLSGRGYNVFCNTSEWRTFLQARVNAGELNRLVAILDTGANDHGSIHNLGGAISQYVVPIMIGTEEDMLEKTLDTIRYLERDLGASDKISTVINSVPGATRDYDRLFSRERTQDIVNHPKIGPRLLKGVTQSLSVADICDRKVGPLTLPVVTGAVNAMYPMVSELVYRMRLPVRLQTERDIRVMAAESERRNRMDRSTPDSAAA